MNKQKVVIIGAVAAGAKAAAKLKRLRPDWDVEVYTQDEHVSYAACGMPYFIKGTFDDVNRLFARSVEDFERQGINIHTGHKCIKLLPDIKSVVIKNLQNGQESVVSYGKLILATGAKPFLPPIKNLNYKNIYTLRNVSDAIAIKEKMHNSKSVTIIGGGYIAIEMLEAFVHNGLKATVITDSMHLMNFYDLDIAKLIQENVLEISKGQADIITSDPVVAIEGENEYASKTITMKGVEVESDFILLCAGIYPNSELAIEAGLETGVKNSIRVDSRMRTSNEHIYAAGDCCEKTGYVSKTKWYIGLGSIANKEGRVAAINAAGYEENFSGILLSAVTKYFDFNIAKVGLTEVMALERGYEILSAKVTKRDRAGYMPDVADITLKMIADAKTGKILGAQAVGYGDAEKRICIVAAAIQGNLGIEDFLNLDLPYAPPFSSVVDVLHICCMQLKDKITTFNKNMTNE